jgi:hypothetical protein
MVQQKTFWHLLPHRRMPSEYEIVTSKLLLNTGDGTRARYALWAPSLRFLKDKRRAQPCLRSTICLPGFQNSAVTIYAPWVSNRLVQRGMLTPAT